MKWIILCWLGFITTVQCQNVTVQTAVWGYECQSNKCMKVEITDNNIDKAVSFPICRIFCGAELGTVWPKPTGAVVINDDVVMRININDIEFIVPEYETQTEFWNINKERFLQQVRNKLPSPKLTVKASGKKLRIKILVEHESMLMTLDTDESYKLVTSINNSISEVLITAKTFYGARHGLETLSQLIVHDEIRNEYDIVQNLEINDEPRYKYRGVLLDTSRNFFSIESIKRTIDGMGMVKLNTFHWHITDSHSFPLELKSHPELSKLGAYSQYKVYSIQDVIDVVKYGKARGIRVLPEFDAPAHVGEGWQHKNLITCFNYQPWAKYCVEPPCGQFDVTKDQLYDILEDIYGEMYENFDKPDIFHMGGDEVSTACWNSSQEVQDWMLKKGWALDTDGFLKLWGYFQSNALARFDKVAGHSNTPIILWTSKLTEPPYIDEYLDKNRYYIQIWTTFWDQQVVNILNRGFKIIVSNYDGLYLDCGFAGWVKDGNNWCSPFIGWQKVYENAPSNLGSQYASQILGAEATLWSEQVDEFTLDSRFWPRLSALAENLWSMPLSTYREAESRMLIHRLRLVQNGIAAERLQPEWCLLNENQCPI